MATMPRAIWSGSISFGLVNVPVKVYSAVSQQDIHFNQFEEGTGARIRYKRVSEKSGKEVPYEKIVKGYEVSKGKFVMITPDELEGFSPRATRTIDIEDFVALDDIDPIYYEHTYYLAPSGSGADKAYSLLLKAMEQAGKVGIGRVVMRTKQYLAAIRPLDGVLAMSTMLFGDEVVDRKKIEELPGRKAEVSKKEVDLARQIVESLSTEWDPNKYEDTYREKVLDLINRKAKGEEIVTEEATAESPKVIDLMAALEASLKAAKKGGSKAVQKAVEEAVETAEDDDGDSDASGDGKGPAKKAAKATKKASKSAKKPAKRATKKSAARKSA
jgi:DNA end-binding protein Ku